MCAHAHAGTCLWDTPCKEILKLPRATEISSYIWALFKRYWRGNNSSKINSNTSRSMPYTVQYNTFSLLKLNASFRFCSSEAIALWAQFRIVYGNSLLHGERVLLWRTCFVIIRKCPRSHPTWNATPLVSPSGSSQIQTAPRLERPGVHRSRSSGFDPVDRTSAKRTRFQRSGSRHSHSTPSPVVFVASVSVPSQSRAWHHLEEWRSIMTRTDAVEDSKFRGKICIRDFKDWIIIQ